MGTKIPFSTILFLKLDILLLDLLEVIHQSNLEAHVKYLGKKYSLQKNNILAETDILAFPTFYEKETFGLVNLEAMQFSKPVVTTNEGAIPDIVEDGITGFLVPQKDAIALADKLEILIKNPELRKLMGAQGRIKYENYYTIKHFEERMISIFNQILNPKYD
jgi:glycosyltransferase involved in cell wall biosynthesis